MLGNIQKGVKSGLPEYMGYSEILIYLRENNIYKILINSNISLRNHPSFDLFNIFQEIFKLQI